MRVYFTDRAQCVIDNATSVRCRSCKIINSFIDVEAVPFNRGYYSVDITFFFKVYLDAYTTPMNPPCTVEGLTSFSKKCILYGSEGNVRIFSSEFSPDEADEQFLPTSANPKAKVQCVDPICLEAKLCRPCGCCECEGCCSAPGCIRRLFDAGQALALFQIAKEQGLEGVVAKRKDSLYFQGTRTRTWLKMKNMTDDDFVVCGYIYKENNMISILLGKYRDGLLTYQGHVTLGVGGAAFSKIKAQPRAIRPPFDVPEGHGNADAVWIEPRLVCVVEYMHKTRSGGMRQPVFKGLRPDKLPEECTE